MLQLGTFNILKMIILPKLIHRFKQTAVPVLVWLINIAALCGVVCNVKQEAATSGSGLS